ncbi:MAG: ABC transporter permease [Candidatus Binatia bacterium]
MAWRDSRGSRQQLLLATFAITIGIAAFVAITSFRTNVREAVHQQAKSLLGADLVLSGHYPLPDESGEIIATFGGTQAHEVSCSSMVLFPHSGGTRLAQIRALAGEFPFYGRLEAQPYKAVQTFRTGLHALVDDNLLLQFEAQVGDPIKIGDLTFQIVGRLKKIPGEAASAALLGPRVYIPLATLEQTGLLQKGSRVTEKIYFQLAPYTDPKVLVEPLQAQLNELRLEVDTVEKRAARVGKVMDNLTRFLNLIGFLALLLGGIGVASAMHVHVKSKLQTVALLHCLGTDAKRTFAIYLLQALCMGVLGGILGGLLGVVVQTVLPSLFHDFLPVKIDIAISWIALVVGFVVAILTTLLFATVPLLSLQRISPLLALRAAYETNDPQLPRQQRLRVLILGIITLSIGVFAFLHTERWSQGLWFCLALGVTFGLLAAVAKLVIISVRVYFPRSMPYVWRQGLANLYRPNNQTFLLILSLGAGTFLLMTVYLSQDALLQQVARTNDGNQPNLILFDIQADQREAVSALVESFTLPVLQEVPLVTMRLAAVKGTSVGELRNDNDKKIPDWALQWEYRATYREHLIETETVVAGVWQGHAEPSSSPTVISLEEEIAQTLKVTVGDELIFDVQGVPLTTVVGSLRKVDWQRVQPNFFVVFPLGVLEQAPQTYVLVSRTATNEQSATLQRAAVQQFPNVSAIDLTLILQTLDTILSRVAFALRFMALFTLATGIIVLMSAILTSRAQRRKEGALLRILGASRRQIRQILTIEYLFIGSFAAIVGLLLAFAASWALMRYMFEATFIPQGRPFLVAFVVVTSVTVLTGLFGSRRLTTRSPLEVLRSEG